MSGYIPRSQNDGLSIAHNRVVNPTVSAFTEVYTSLPEDMWLGFPAEGNGIKAVLCRAGGTALAANVLAQAPGDALRSDTIVGNDGPTFQQVEGDRVIYVVQASIAVDAWAGRRIYINGHSAIEPYIIKGNTASGAVSDGDTTTAADVANVVTITLDRPLTAAAGESLAVTIENTYNDSAVGIATNTNKVLGYTLAAVPANNYFWAVYAGKIYKTTASSVAAAGDYLTKGAAGVFDAVEIAGSAEQFDNEVIGRYEGANIIDLNIYHPGLP